MELDRRTFMRGAGALGAAAGLGTIDRVAAAAEHGGEVATRSRAAYAELLELLTTLDRDYLGERQRITTPRDIADGHRYILHLLDGATDLYFESDPEYPIFKRIVSPSRKANGDNPDAIYFTTAIRGDRRYRVRGRLAGATYTSFTVEAGEGEDGERTAGVLNDQNLEVDGDGAFEIELGPDAKGANTIALPGDAVRLTTRHYFERERSVAADGTVVIPLHIEALDRKGPPPDWDDARIAEGIRRVTRRLRVMTVDREVGTPESSPSWVSLVPNQFNAPEKPGDLGKAAFDAAYAMAPYALGPNDALVIEGRFPKCRFANVVLWNRYLQSYDYAYRQISRNRAQTSLEEDGSFRMVVAHADPGVPNWLDTMGRASGLIYWRFMLPEGSIATPRARVVPLASIA